MPHQGWNSQRTFSPFFFSISVSLSFFPSLSLNSHYYDLVIPKTLLTTRLSGHKFILSLLNINPPISLVFYFNRRNASRAIGLRAIDKLCFSTSLLIQVYPGTERHMVYYSIHSPLMRSAINRNLGKYKLAILNCNYYYLIFLNQTKISLFSTLNTL